MLLDTSGLLCLYHQSEPFHQQAIHAYKTSQMWLTHSYVLAEFVALTTTTARRFPRTLVLEYLDALIDHPDIELIWIDEQLHRAAFALLLARRDKEYSLCDAVSFVLMRQRNLYRALTTDKHFDKKGLSGCLNNEQAMLLTEMICKCPLTVSGHYFLAQ